MSLEAAVALVREGFSLRTALTVEAGEVVALLGPNGAGKSTLVHVLAGLVPAAEGRVVLGGRTLEDAATGTRVPPEDRGAGVVFQDLRLFPRLAALDNVAFPLRARGVRTGPARTRAAALLGRFGIGARAGAFPADLSRGEAQRVALARALAASPGLLLLDEPLSALDVGSRGVVRSRLLEMLAGFAGPALLVTHDPVEAMTLADRLVLLEGGRVTQVGTPAEIREAPRTRYAAELVGVNLYVGRLVPGEEGTGRLVTPDGELIVAWPDEPRRTIHDVVALVRPADVTLFPERPAGSARNVLRGEVAALAHEGDRVRVRVEAPPPVVAEVTPGSAHRLGLRVGTPVWASFKAVEVRVVVRAGAPPRVH